MQTHELYQGYYNKLATLLRISEKDQQRMDNLWETLCKAREYLVRHSRGQGPLRETHYKYIQKTYTKNLPQNNRHYPLGLHGPCRRKELKKTSEVGR